MHVIPQEFENLLQTSQRYKSGVNCPPNEAWKMIASIDKLKTRPYLEGNDVVLDLLSKSAKAYQTGLEISSNRSSYKATDVTRQFMQASDLLLKAFNAYSASKDVQITNQNAVNQTPNLISTANTVHEFMTPYYGDQSNKVQRCVRFVEKTDTMPTIYQEGAITCNARPAQFGKGLEAWLSFKKQPNTIWIVGRSGGAFDSNKDVIDFIRQYFPNLTFFNNIILFAREVAEWNKDAPVSGSPLQSPFGQPFDINYKAYLDSNLHVVGSKAAEFDAVETILGKIKKIGAIIVNMVSRGFSVTGYAAFVLAMRTYIGLIGTISNQMYRLSGNYYEGNPSKSPFLIDQLKKAFALLDKEFGKGNANDKFVDAKFAEIAKLVNEITDTIACEYIDYKSNMRAKSGMPKVGTKSFLDYSLAAEAGSIKADLGSTIKYWAKAIIRALVEITAWTAYSLTRLTFDVILSALSTGLHLIIQLWNKLRIILIENSIKNDPEHDQSAFYNYIEYQNELEAKSKELESFSGEEYSRIALRFKKYLQGLKFIVERCKRMLEEDFLNDSSMSDPYGVDKYLRSYMGTPTKGVELLKGTVGTILVSIKRCVFIGLGAISKLVSTVVGSSAFRYSVKTLLITFINLAKILNSLIGAGLNVAEAMLKDKEITTQTDKIIGILSRISPESVIEPETVENLKYMFDPIFEKLQYLYSHPDVAFKNVLDSIKSKLGGSSGKAPSYSQGGASNVSRSGGSVYVSNNQDRAPAFASIMDSDSSKLIDTHMVGNADSEYGYVPSPLPVSVGM